MILVTGGAGYIGSHTVKALLESGVSADQIVVLDNLYSGHRWAVPDNVHFVEGDTGDAQLLEGLFAKHSFKTILHFAAHLEVGESVLSPNKYYRNNFDNARVLIDQAYVSGVKEFIFSSTCATIGSPRELPVSEDAYCRPESPYGKSKLMTEWYLADREVAASHKKSEAVKFTALRYFNVAGAYPGGGLGQATPNATQLIKVACEVIEGKREKLLLFGTDYPTKDGTCVRDYIHVYDLALAHVAAWKYLQDGGSSEIINLGYGHGYTVREIIETVKKVSGVDFPVEEVERRPGDAEAIYADTSKADRLLKWKPRHDDIEEICRTALAWEAEMKAKGL